MCPSSKFTHRGKFQLTPSRRATLSRKYPVHGNRYFNSRPHGGRREPYYHANQTGKFQLTPSRRATVRSASLRALISFQLTPSRRATHIQIMLWFITHFNSRPHGGRLYFLRYRQPRNRISTHALTEGDGKFRQIFLLNRGYAYSISLYFLPHFISLLPQILSFQQKSFKFQVRIFLLFSVHLAFALQNQCVHHVKYRFCTNMFYFVFVLFTQIVKPQTIGLFIYDFF